MISNDTLERLRSFKLSGFIEALQAQENGTDAAGYRALTFEERLTLLVDHEVAKRRTQRIARLLAKAKLPSSMSITDVDFSSPRGVNRKQLLSYAQGTWVQKGENMIIAGKTGVGKTFLAGALAHSLCMQGTSVRYQRTSDWLIELGLAAARYRTGQKIAGLRKIPLLIFDEWMRDPITVEQSRLLLDLIDDRYERCSLMLVSQFDVKHWHERFDDPTIADAILDRLVHNAHRIEATGESRRRRTSKPCETVNGEASLRSDNQ